MGMLIHNVLSLLRIEMNQVNVLSSEAHHSCIWEVYLLQVNCESGLVSRLNSRIALYSNSS